MITAFAGSLTAAVSGYGIYYSFRNMRKVGREKDNFIASAASLDAYPYEDGITKRLVKLENLKRAGILEVYKEVEVVEVKYEKFSDGSTKPVTERKYFWDIQSVSGINLDFGRADFIPPANLNFVLKNILDEVVQKSGDPAVLSEYLKSQYNSSFQLPYSGTFKASFTNFENKVIYAYGTRKNGKFHADLLSSQVNLIANNVYAVEDAENSTMLILSLIGVISGVGLVLSSR